MTLSIWRYAHLTLAVFSALFLIIASITGCILAVDAAGQKVSPYRVHNFEEITLSEVLPVLRKKYIEVSELSVDHNQFTTLKGLDQDGNDVNAYIDPLTGNSLGTPEKKNSFIQWVTSLHRSLFLHETGRLIVGIVSFLLFLIAISGMVLVVQRQKGLHRFFSKIVKDYFAQYYHVVLGRLMLIPVIIIALSGTYLCMQRFKLFPENQLTHKEISFPDEAPKQKDIAGFAIFKEIHLAQVQKIEFPFDTEDPQEFFTVKLTDRELHVDQFTGKVLSEVRYPASLIVEKLSLDLHTGRANFVWAIVLGIASLNILFFMYSGFAMTLRRRQVKIRNKYKAEESRIILLAGSENGSTLRFTNAIHTQLLANGCMSYLAEMNQYAQYPKAEHIVVFTATHGLGDAPFNANKFLSLIEQNPQKKTVNFSVVGFGSGAYPDFCGYAKKVHDALALQSWSNSFINLHTVDDKSPAQFVAWVKEWGAKAGITLAATPASYAQKPAGLEKMMVVEKTPLSVPDQTFQLTIKPGMRSKYTSGDLLAVYPANDGRERFYSIAKSNSTIQLVVKLHEPGLGSGYLYSLKPGSVIKAGIIKNKAFHLPKKAPAVAMIANGTGIAPFLGMIAGNKSKLDCTLYCGFRYETDTVHYYKAFAAEQIRRGKLKDFSIAFSREQDHHYVMDLIEKDSGFFAGLLHEGGTVMICGSLAMQQDVEKILNTICTEKNGNSLTFYKENGQLLTDCY